MTPRKSSGQHLLHRHTAAAVAQLDPCHVGPHEGESTPARHFQVFIRAAVGHFAWIIALAFVADFYVEPFGGKFAINMHLLVGVVLVAVANRIADRLLERHVNTEEVLFGPGKTLERIKDLLYEIVISRQCAREVSMETARLLG